MKPTLITIFLFSVIYLIRRAMLALFNFIGRLWNESVWSEADNAAVKDYYDDKEKRNGEI